MSRISFSARWVPFLGLVMTTGAGLASVPALAEVLVVRSDGTGDYATIQGAVDSANDGDVLLMTGVFNESIQVSGQQLSFVGSGEAVVEPRKQGRAFHFSAGADCTIVGLTVRGGGGVEEGGGLLVRQNVRLQISQSVFEAIKAGVGAVLQAGTESVVSFDECTFRGNESSLGHIVGSSGILVVQNCIFEDNMGGTPILIAGDGQVRDSRFKNNVGSSAGAIAVFGDGNSEITGNVVTGCTGATGEFGSRPMVTPP